jgi:SAM-dependent methyltransferase
MKCQVCGSSKIKFIDNYCPYLDYCVDVFDCETCLSRFTPHEADVHEKLHSQSSKYFFHEDIEKRTGDLLRQGDVATARSFLAERAANSFIMETVESLPSANNLLEMGCSRGYLAAYFLANNRNVLGVDISPTAVAAATNSFGDHFCVAGDPKIKAGAPYDAIYHVGTIGCVASPIEFTRELLKLLKPGGLLIFNTPNRMSCDLSGRLWLSTPPPDLVNLFHPDLWRNDFSDAADSNVEVLMWQRLSSAYFLRLTRLQKSPATRLFDAGKMLSPSFVPRIIGHLITLYFFLSSSPLPHEYGIQVVLRAKP